MKIKKPLLLVVGSIVIALALFLLYRQYDYLFTFEFFKEKRELFAAYVQEHYVASLLIFSFAYFTKTALALPATAVLTLLSGFLFGTLLGTLICILTATMGATCAFLAIRYLFARHFYARFSPEYLAKVNRELHKHEFLYLLFLRFVPIFPFFLINILLALTTVSVRSFVITTAIGIIPATAVYAYAGQQFAVITKISDIMTWKILVLFGVLKIGTLAPLLWKKMQKKEVQ